MLMGMKRLAVLLVLLAALALPLAAAYGGSSGAQTQAPAPQAPAVDHGGGDCPFAAVDASV
jgi:hypothetical protein